MEKEEFSEFVKKQREKSGMTQFRFAVALEISLMTVNRWEKAQSMPHDDALEYWVKEIKKVCKK